MFTNTVYLISFRKAKTQCHCLLDVMALSDSFLFVCHFGGDFLPCYHPQLLSYVGINENGKKEYKFTGMQGRHLTDLEKRSYQGIGSDDILIPCRRCIGCRLDYSRRWADRLMLELDHSKTALFFTLTYDNEHITPATKLLDEFGQPIFGTLVKRDLQLFNKRLREHFSGKEIRFFAAGEYGDKTLRPHYHGIYFGLDLADFPDAKLFSLNHAQQPLYTSDILSKKIWKNGHCLIGRVSWQSCAYVARYNLKKLAAGNDDVTLARGCLPEFGLMSRKPGIAGYFPIDHPEVFDNPRDKIYLTDSFGVRSVNEVNLPNYLFNKLELVNPELYAIIKEEKKLSELSSFLAELSQTDLDEYEYLCVKESSHENRISSLHRPLE